MKIISTTTKTSQPNPNENKQTSSHVGKLVASSGIKNGVIGFSFFPFIYINLSLTKESKYSEILLN